MTRVPPSQKPVVDRMEALGLLAVCPRRKGSLAGVFRAYERIEIIENCDSIEEEDMTTITKTISAAQLKDLVANPVEIVPAPGVGKVIWPISFFGYYKFNTTAFVGSSAVTFLPIGTSSNGLNSGIKSAEDIAMVDSFGNTSTLLANAPVVLGNNGSDLTDGDGTLTITVLYREVDLT